MISWRGRPINCTETLCIARAGMPAARAVSTAMGASGPLTISTVGTPNRSTSMRSRTLRDVQVAQSPTATTNAA